MEIIHGVRDRDEMREIKSFLSDYGFKVLPISENIGNRASIYLEEYGLSVAIGIVDTFIAATAVQHNLVLCTGNRKHYKPIKDLKIRLFRPKQI